MRSLGSDGYRSVGRYQLFKMVESLLQFPVVIKSSLTVVDTWLDQSSNICLSRKLNTKILEYTMSASGDFMFEVLT